MNVIRGFRHYVVTAFLIFAAAVFVTSPGSTAQADSNTSGIVISPAIMYLYNHTDVGGNSSNDTNHYLLDVNLGYRFDSPLYIGALYTVDDTVATGSPDTDNIGAYGLSLGLDTDSLYLIVSYYIGAEEKLSTGGATDHDYTSGSGYQVALGYKFPVSGSFYVGPQINYRSIRYSNDSAGNNNFTHTEFLPYINLWFVL